MKLLILFTLLGLALAQIDGDASFEVSTQWPQNDQSNAGAIVNFVYSDIGEGSCSITLPEAVHLFHVMNGHIVPGDETSPIEGKYKVAAPAGWEAVNGTLSVLIVFERDNIFNVTDPDDLEFVCDPADVADLSVYSFPQNDLVKEASSNVHYRPGFHQGDVLTITLPNEVARFNITGADSRYEIDSEGGTTFTVSGFQNEDGVDDMKEVHFSIDYLGNETDTSNWFSAGDVTVSVTQQAPADEAAP